MMQSESFEKNILDTDSELLVCKYLDGITLLRNEKMMLDKKNSFFTGYNVEKLLNFPCNVYFLNLHSQYQNAILEKQPVADSLCRIRELGILNKSEPDGNKKELSAGKEILGNYFSPREIQCIQHLIRGKSSKEIAKILNLSFRTIEHYIDNIKIKMRVQSKYELIEKIVDYLIGDTKNISAELD